MWNFSMRLASFSRSLLVFWPWIACATPVTVGIAVRIKSPMTILKTAWRYLARCTGYLEGVWDGSSCLA